MEKSIIRNVIINNQPIVNSLGKELHRNLLKYKFFISSEISEQDCIDYIFNLTINRTYDGYIREKSVIEDNLAKVFPEIKFEESDPELDHAGDIDYLGWINNKAFGIQIKPVTAKSNFGNYSASERMQQSFDKFSKQFGGKVFIVFSVDDKIYNENVIELIKEEIIRLSK